MILEKDIISFLDTMSKQGFIPSNTISAQKAAVTKVLSILTENEQNGGIGENTDIDELLRRFANKSKHELNPQSLNTYGSRFKTALRSYLDWNKNPLAFKPKTRRGRPVKLQQTETNIMQNHEKEIPAQFHDSKESINLNPIIKYPIPVENMQGSLEIPRKLTTSDVTRIIPLITAIIKAHCQDKNIAIDS